MNRYYLRARPPMPGTIPAGAYDVEAYDYRTFQADAGRDVWGWAEYKRELTAQEINDYELIQPLTT